VELDVEHGIVCDMPDQAFGYFAWTSVGRMDDGEIVVVSSGLRSRKNCPWGKIVANTSNDEGRTWSTARPLNDIPLDERDAGIVCLGGTKRLLSFECVDSRSVISAARDQYGQAEVSTWQAVTDAWTEAVVEQWIGAWTRLSANGENWSEPVRAPVCTPHGPIQLRSGELLYLGNPFPPKGPRFPLAVFRSANDGRSWTHVATIPQAKGWATTDFSEPHVVELPSGKLVAMLRYNGDRYVKFSLFQTESEDGGTTWSAPRQTDAHGAPPHLLLHSSGALICTYGYRRKPYGQRVMLSYDGGESWTNNIVLRDDALDEDLGYPSSVELSDGSILTVYYQKLAPVKNTSVLWTRWRLPR